MVSQTNRYSQIIESPIFQARAHGVCLILKLNPLYQTQLKYCSVTNPQNEENKVGKSTLLSEVLF